jgi:hypothetical protein
MLQGSVPEPRRPNLTPNPGRRWPRANTGRSGPGGAGCILRKSLAHETGTYFAVGQPMPGVQLSVPSSSSSLSSRRSSAATSPSTTHALPITLRVGHAFPQHAMLAGYACFLRGVQLSKPREGEVLARIAAPLTFQVRLRAQHKALAIACTCHASSDPREACEHAWAALLALDGANELRELRMSAEPLRVELTATPASTAENLAETSKPTGPSLKKTKLQKAQATSQPPTATPRKSPGKRQASASRKVPR